MRQVLLMLNLRVLYSPLLITMLVSSKSSLLVHGTSSFKDHRYATVMLEVLCLSIVCLFTLMNDTSLLCAAAKGWSKNVKILG